MDQSLAYAVDEGGTVDGDLTDAGMLYTLTDRKYDVLGVVDASGDRIERIRYSPYGESITRDWILADLDGDGVVGAGDMSVLLAEWGGNPDSPGNLNADGTVDSADMADLTAAWGQSGERHDGGRFSEHENVVGYSGYLYDEAVENYCVRFRWYDAEQGRWLTRDPIIVSSPTNYAGFRAGSSASPSYDYLDGSSMLQYVRSGPLSFVDPAGLESIGVQRLNLQIVLEEYLTMLFKMKMSQGQIAMHLIALGISVHAVQELNPSLAQVMRNNIDCLINEVRESINDAVERTAENMKKLGKEVGCDLANRMKDIACGPRDNRKSFKCGGIKTGPGADCNDIAFRGMQAASCAAARDLELALCKFPSQKKRHGHIQARDNTLNAFATCLANWQKCKRNNPDDRSQRPGLGHCGG